MNARLSLYSHVQWSLFSGHNIFEIIFKFSEKSSVLPARVEKPFNVHSRMVARKHLPGDERIIGNPGAIDAMIFEIRNKYIRFVSFWHINGCLA